MPWGITGAWRRFDVNVESLVRWVSLRNRLQSRCLWPAYADECSYRYFMVVEVLSTPGEALGYNCAVKDPTCTETAAVSVDADAAACAAVTDSALDSADACQAVMTAGGVSACTYTPIRDDASCTDECDAIKDAVLASCDETDTYTNSAGIVADYNAMVGAMNVQMACAEFTCGLNAIGEAFCGVLESMAMTDLETEDTVTGSGEMTSMAGFVELGCNAQLSLAPIFMSLLPDDYLPPRALACIAEMSRDHANVLVKNICACTLTEMCPNDQRFVPGGFFYDDTTATTCTLVPSTDHGATLGTCTDSDTTDTAYCTYSRGSYCWSAGTVDTVAISDSCTSVAVAGGAEVESDTTNCYLTGSTDFGVTEGTCDPTPAAGDAYTCTYVPGTYCSSTGVPDTETAADSCTSTTPQIAGSAEIDCSGAPGDGGADCVVGCTYVPPLAAACGGAATDGVTDCSSLAADTACTDAGCSLTEAQTASCGANVPEVAATGGDVTSADTDNCVLTGSTDFGVTPGSCADVNSNVATCEYVPGTYRIDAAKDVTPRNNGESCVVVTPPAADMCETGALDTAPASTPPSAGPASPAPVPTSAATTPALTAALLVAVAMAAFA